jgi:hypothetical protein
MLARLVEENRKMKGELEDQILRGFEHSPNRKNARQGSVSSAESKETNLKKLKATTSTKFFSQIRTSVIKTPNLPESSYSSKPTFKRLPSMRSQMEIAKNITYQNIHLKGRSRTSITGQDITKINLDKRMKKFASVYAKKEMTLFFKNSKWLQESKINLADREDLKEII